MQSLSLVTESNEVVGLITLDVQRGEMVALKAKSVILATDGLESAWNGGSGGTGLWLAANAGVSLNNLEFVGWNPLSMQMHGLQLPFAILDDGAAVRSVSGSDIEFSAEGGISEASQSLINSGEQCVLDARVLTRGTPVWYGDTSERVSSRLGGQMSETVIPISPQVSTTLGGIPCDNNGNVSSLTGLFAAGDCACSGFHGADMAVGNRLLDSLDGGNNAGTSAAEHVTESQFAGSDAIDAALSVAAARFGKLLATADSGMTRGQVSNQLNTIMSDSMGVSREGASLSGAAEQLSQLAETQITLSDDSPVMNTELVEVFRLEGMVKVSLNAVESAMARTESCGSHQRSDE
jgi:succinate dehydrogenase/fumarate reductase flavoprotein subunit